jgi:hypothetical protein
MPEKSPDKNDGSSFPPDMAAICGLLFMVLASITVTSGLSWATSRGDTTLFNLALFLGAVGVFLLAIARIPLYRQHRFFTIGPKSLSGVYRRLYIAAYVFIVPSIALLVLLLLAFG